MTRSSIPFFPNSNSNFSPNFENFPPNFENFPPNLKVFNQILKIFTKFRKFSRNFKNFTEILKFFPQISERMEKIKEVYFRTVLPVPRNTDHATRVNEFAIRSTELVNGSRTKYHSSSNCTKNSAERSIDHPLLYEKD